MRYQQKDGKRDRKKEIERDRMTDKQKEIILLTFIHIIKKTYSFCNKSINKLFRFLIKCFQLDILWEKYGDLRAEVEELKALHRKEKV